METIEQFDFCAELKRLLEDRQTTGKSGKRFN